MYIVNKDCVDLISWEPSLDRQLLESTKLKPIVSMQFLNKHDIYSGIGLTFSMVIANVTIGTFELSLKADSIINNHLYTNDFLLT